MSSGSNLAKSHQPSDQQHAEEEARKERAEILARYAHQRQDSADDNGQEFDRASRSIKIVDDGADSIEEDQDGELSEPEKAKLAKNKDAESKRQAEADAVYMMAFRGWHYGRFGLWIHLRAFYLNWGFFKRTFIESAKQIGFAIGMFLVSRWAVSADLKPYLTF